MAEQFKIGSDVIRTTAPPYFKNEAVFSFFLQMPLTKPKAMEKCIFSVAFVFKVPG
jgi:hypothetical protein